MPDIISNIYTELETLVSSMTTAGGYNYDWLSTSVNPKDFDFAEAVVTSYDAIWPVCLIHYGDEEVVAPTMSTLGVNGQTYTNDISFIFDVFLGASSENTADVEINKAISDLKKLIFNDDCLNGKAFIVLYVRHRRETAFADQLDWAGRLAFEITVRYSQDVTDPEILA